MDIPIRKSEKYLLARKSLCRFFISRLQYWSKNRETVPPLFFSRKKKNVMEGILLSLLWIVPTAYRVFIVKDLASTVCSFRGVGVCPASFNTVLQWSHHSTVVCLPKKLSISLNCNPIGTRRSQNLVGSSITSRRFSTVTSKPVPGGLIITIIPDNFSEPANTVP